jgi:hypothetical protein
MVSFAAFDRAGNFSFRLVRICSCARSQVYEMITTRKSLLCRWRWKRDTLPCFMVNIGFLRRTISEHHRGTQHAAVGYEDLQLANGQQGSSLLRKREMWVRQCEPRSGCIQSRIPSRHHQRGIPQGLESKLFSIPPHCLITAL